MDSFQRIISTYIARNLEFVRDRAALGWSLIFPFLLVMGFSFAFNNQDAGEYKIGIIGNSIDAAQPSIKFVDFIPFINVESAKDKLNHHKIDLLVDVSKKEYWINKFSKKSYLAEKVISSAISNYNKRQIESQTIRYVDWVIPGVLAMNMMFGALYGLGYVLVNYRKNGVLRRFKSTPVSVFEFLSAQIASRLTVVLVINSIVFIGTKLLINFKMEGSYFDLIFVFILGSLCMISLGLIIAARTTSKEFADGVLNMIGWPMMLASGVWFSLEGVNPLLQKAAQVLPLTHLVDASRSIMLDGASLSDVSFNCYILVLLTALFGSIGLYLFKWE